MWIEDFSELERLSQEAARCREILGKLASLGDKGLEVQAAFCEELGLGYERVAAGGAFGRTRDPDYLAMNPNALVPTIEDDGFVLWESHSIVRYLAAKHGAGTLIVR